MSKLKIGDKVNWRGDFGMAEPREAIVEGIDLTKGGKYGDPVNEIEWSQVYDRNVVVTLDNGHWAYADQISEVLTVGNVILDALKNKG